MQQNNSKKDNFPKNDIFASSSLTTGYFYQHQNNLNHSDQQQSPHHSEQPTSHQQLIEQPQTSRRRSKLQSNSTPNKQQPQNTQEDTQPQNSNIPSVKKPSKTHHRRTYKKTTNKRNIQELEMELEILDDEQLQKHDLIMLSKETAGDNEEKDVKESKEKLEEVFQLDDLQAEFQVEKAIQNLKPDSTPNQKIKKKVKQEVVFQQSSDDQGQSPQRLHSPQLLPLSSQSSLAPQKQPTLTENASQVTQRPPEAPKPQITKEHMFKILTYPVKQNMIMRTNLERVNGFLFNAYPEYHVYFESDKTHLMSAKRVSRTPFSTFVISKSKTNFTQNSQDYLGKAKGSALGDELNLYGKGFSPANALLMKIKPRQLLATIVYETRIILAGQPRNFKVYIKKPDVDYYQSFPQVKIYGEEIPLNLLYQNPHNRQHIIVLQNKKPQYHTELKGYSLNFRGRVGLASVKNFVLEKVPEQNKKQTEQQSPQKTQKPDFDTMIFGKAKDNTFNMDLSSPLSPVIAFGIALSTFDEKYFCE